MKLKTMPLRTFALSAGALAVMLPAAWRAPAQEAKSAYPTMAPIDQYLIADRDAEIALARTAAPKSISDDAEVLVLGRDGYTTAVKGGNGFVCLVERAFAASTDFSEYWNPKNRSPICLNAAAARTNLPLVEMKAKLVLAGKIEGGDRTSGHIGVGQQGAAAAGARRDVLHDVEAAVLERRSRELASTPDVVCSRPGGSKLGSECGGLAGYCGG